MDKRKRRLLCMLEGSGRKSRWISGVPPLSFRAKKAGTLENYRIYGNTVGGESVGDLVESGEHAGEYEVPVTVEGKNLYTGIEPFINSVTDTRDFIRIWFRGTRVNDIRDSIYLANSVDATAGSHIVKTFTMVSGYERFYVKHNGNSKDIEIINQLLKPGITYTLSFDVKKNNPSIIGGIEISDIQIEEKENATTYEPYHAPVTTPIYLPEPIKMVGEEAEYIDYGEQKMHRIGADDINVTLPALPTIKGANVLSVGTAVQPSRVEVKGRIKAVG